MINIILSLEMAVMFLSTSSVLLNRLIPTLRPDIVRECHSASFWNTVPGILSPSRLVFRDLMGHELRYVPVDRRCVIILQYNTRDMNDEVYKILWRYITANYRPENVMVVIDCAPRGNLSGFFNAPLNISVCSI